MKRHSGLALQWLVAGLGVMICSPGYAQNYPTKSVRLVVPFAPGGSTDTPWRIVAPRLAEELGQQVVIDNRPAAGSTVGAAIVAKSPADGYTLLGTSVSHVISGALYRDLPYDALNDFVSIGQIADTSQVLVVHPALPVKTVAQLIALAKAKPGAIDYATSGSGTSQHLSYVLFTSLAGIDMTHVPYKGSSQQIPDLIAGRVPTAFVGVSVVLPHVTSNRLRALGSGGSRRSPFMPDVPTIDESGLKGYKSNIPAGMLAPRGLPPEVMQRLEADLKKVMSRPDVQKGITASGNEPIFDTGANFNAMLKAESAKWGKLIRDLNIRVE
ncbi:MAG: Bug family tripartite tricarboxylate transporter substrate binding protein [Burkholderiales bacterium]